MRESSPPRDPILDALVDICGPDYARAARSVDAVDGRRVRYVAVPATTRALADALRLAADRGLTAMPRGSGSKIDWGRPPAGVDLLIDTARLGGLWHHDTAARFAEVGTGTPVSALQAALALRGQRLAVDPPSRTATVGGMLAVNESGPLRLRFGVPADYVERVAYVDAAGKTAESDGEAGRPGLGEIAGVITTATLRLEPLPEARLWVGVAVATPLQVLNLTGEALAHRLDLSALEVDLPRPDGGLDEERPPGTLAALFEGDQATVAARAARLAAAWGAGAVTTPIAPPWWGRYPFGRADAALRLSVPVADLPAAVYALRDAAGSPVPIRGSAGLGSVFAVLPGTSAPERVERMLDSVRHVLMARNGRVAVLKAPPDLARHIDMATRNELF